MTDQDFRGLRVVAFESRMAVEMARLIERYGGRPLVAPSMQEIPLQDNREVLTFGERLLAGQVDLLILLTGVGTRAMIDVLKTRYAFDEIKAALRRVTLVARGPKPVGVLKELGLTATMTVPEPNTWRDIVQTLDAQKPVAGLQIAVQEYGVSNLDLLAALKERGALVSPVPVYRWALPDDLDPLKKAINAVLNNEIEVILITNAVQIDHVMQLLVQQGKADRFRQAAGRMVIASIGPTASERLKSHGLPVDLEPAHPKMGTLVKETSERAHALLKSKQSTRS